MSQAAQILLGGGTVAIPTETVYGLGADAASDAAVRKVFEAKGRPPGHPLIVHLASADQLTLWATPTDPRVQDLAEAFWPGPLTLILPRTDRVTSLAVGGRATVGIRVPSHPVASAILEAFGGGLAAPSANRFGHVSPTTAEHVLADLDGRIDAVVDGGSTTLGIESTILELAGGDPTLLRPGGVSTSEIEAVLGAPVVDGSSTESRAAGMLPSHYAPRAEVEIVSSVDPGRLRPDVAVVGPVSVQHSLSWWLPEDATGYAEGLYRAFRAADASGAQLILVVPPERGDLLDAVMDRLTKASTTSSQPQSDLRFKP